MKRALVVVALLGASLAVGMGAAGGERFDPDEVYCPPGSAPFDGTNACACETNASVVLGQNQPDGTFEYWETECPAEYVPPVEETEVLGAEVVAVPADAPVAVVADALPAFTG